ncbi:hypothetical protein MC45_03990 [Sphingomonas taxi]|uniref:Uncharacterized protein n=1 Tax=Sphingomonas taxi TaxID=1549858 RepID=A0A097EDS9_9SPHN|nr:hypothetical protein MC45_03990 [Sphingomonas taxi]
MTELGVRRAPSPFVIPAEAGSHGCGTLIARADADRAVSMGPGFRRDDDGGVCAAGVLLIGPSGG